LCHKYSFLSAADQLVQSARKVNPTRRCRDRPWAEARPNQERISTAYRYEPTMPLWDGHANAEWRSWRGGLLDRAKRTQRAARPSA
jgi:hypothetical protein